MSKEIIINVSGDQSRIAIVENGELVELYVENPENVRTIGDIYLGRVRRILPGIKAAFVDIGQKQDAFLHFSDLSENLPQLLELARGEVPDRERQPLPTAPKTEGESTLELESPEEQRAARRRRDLQRGRERGRRQKEQPKTEAPEAEAEAQQPEPKAAPKPTRTRSRRAPKTEQPEAEQATPEAQGAPEILPPEAVEPPPQQETAGADAMDEEQDAEPKPGRRRGRRGGRRRRRAADQPEAAETEATSEEPVAEEPVADAEPAGEAAPKRARGRRKPAAQKPQEEPAPQPAAEAEPTPEEAAPKKRRPAPKRAEPKAEAEPAPAQPKPEPAQPRPTPRSRFVIDLTSKTGRIDPGNVEEEEEEEERTERSSRGRRSTGSRRDARRGTSARSREAKPDGGRPNGNGQAPEQEPAGPRPETYLKQDQRIIVKITKEPISAKGPRVSTDISLAGRFLVLIPMTDYVAVSKKIESAKERRRLRALARSLLPEGFGLIVRTVAEGRDAKALDTDLRLLLQKWRKIEEQLRSKPEPPVRLYEDVNMVSSIVRDLFSEDYEKIIVDDPKAYRNIKTYVQAVAPQMAGAVQLHKSGEPVFRKAGIEKDVRAAFETRVGLPGGGYLFVETTEAMHVIDVNSGRAGKGMSQEENALKVNLEAAKEIAKQLRLRDLGGIIVVDFIDMRSDSYRKKVYDELKKHFRRDRAVTKLLPMSDFGLVEITRQRLRPSITTTIDVDEFAPLPDEPEDAAGPASASNPAATAGPQPTASEVVGQLEQWLVTYRAEVSERHLKRPILVRVHPFLAAYLQRGIPSTFTRWKFRTRLKMRLDVDESTPPLSFSVRDEKSGKNLTKKYDPARRNGEED